MSHLATNPATFCVSSRKWGGGGWGVFSRMFGDFYQIPSDLHFCLYSVSNFLAFLYSNKYENLLFPTKLQSCQLKMSAETLPHAAYSICRRHVMRCLPSYVTRDYGKM